MCLVLLCMLKAVEGRFYLFPARGAGGGGAVVRSRGSGEWWWRNSPVHHPPPTRHLPSIDLPLWHLASARYQPPSRYPALTHHPSLARYAALYARDRGGWALFAEGDEGDVLCATLYVGGS
jgi:hypothetical protein